MKILKTSAMYVKKLNEFLKEFQGEHYVELTEEDLTRKLWQTHIEIVTVGDTKLIGLAFTYVTETLSRKVLCFDEFIIDKKYRGQGYGKKLMRKIIKLAKQQEVDCIEASVKDDNIPAQKLYEKFKFEDRHNKSLRLWLN